MDMQDSEGKIFFLLCWRRREGGEADLTPSIH